MSRKQKYKDIADKIIRIIHDENLKAGDRLPSEKQLAEVFGVNHLTVRRALECLSEKELIHKIPSKGNYVGKGEQNKTKSNLIGVLFPEEEAFFFEVLTGLEERMSIFGYSPVMHISRRSFDREKFILETFTQLGVDGVIAVPNEACFQLYRMLEIPVVFFDTFIDGLEVPYIVTDDFRGACDAVNHLVALGHRKIAYIGGKNDLTAQVRFDGYKTVLGGHKIPLQQHYIFEKEYSRQWGYNAAGALLASKEPPTAVVCGNDTIAAGVLGYMSNSGIRCPDVLSVVGFGNLGFAEGLGLTTVSQSCLDIANTTWGAMLSQINKENSVLKTTLPTSLILRRSTAAVAR